MIRVQEDCEEWYIWHFKSRRPDADDVRDKNYKIILTQSQATFKTF